ncbi:hypothetical protein BC628DRAFT_1339413 [Trametes gibbosa]|nr:hypothetical protein BC628DRAFT_1339413 [Trametes gibbosa]
MCYKRFKGGQPAGEGLEAMDFICPLCHISEVRQNWKDTKSKGSKDANVDAQYKARHSIPPVKVALNVLIYEGPLKWTSHGIVPQVLYEAMKPYLVEEEEGNLIYKEVEFDLNTNEDVDVHPEQIMAALGPLASTDCPQSYEELKTHCLRNVVAQSLYLGRHSRVIMLFTLDNGRTLQVSEFIWLNCGIMWLRSRTQSWRMRMSELQPSAQRAHGQPGLLSATPGWRSPSLTLEYSRSNSPQISKSHRTLLMPSTASAANSGLPTLNLNIGPEREGEETWYGIPFDSLIHLTLPTNSGFRLSTRSIASVQ